MKISTKGRYSLAVLSDIAKNSGNDEYVSLKSISNRMEVSMKYLEKIVNTLVKENYLDVSRGKQGGYKLNRKVEEYIVGDILRLTEKNMASVSCVDNPESCKSFYGCKRYLLWEGLDKVINNYLDNVTLKDII